MDATVPLVVPLQDARTVGNQFVGGKAAKLSDLIASGYPVPKGFCITTEAYRRELKLDVKKSAMAVVVQELVATDRSGVGFGIDPSAPGEDLQVIEA